MTRQSPQQAGRQAHRQLVPGPFSRLSPQGPAAAHDRYSEAARLCRRPSPGRPSRPQGMFPGEPPEPPSPGNSPATA
jgi:hypothetical protein